MSDSVIEPPRQQVSLHALPEGGDWHGELLRQIGSLKFGVVQVVVHAGRVVQIERTEKFRIESKGQS